MTKQEHKRDLLRHLAVELQGDGDYLYTSGDGKPWPEAEMQRRLMALQELLAEFLRRCATDE